MDDQTRHSGVMAAPPSTIIVLCTGRCGSMTLSRACGHLTNYTAAHESRTHLIGPARFDFGTNHIEIDNRLAWFTGRLEAAWGDRAAYVHLTREAEDVAQSFAKRAHQGILKAYRGDLLARSQAIPPVPRLIDFCRDYVETVTQNIHLFLRDKSHVMEMSLETMAEDFDVFAGWIGAEGDLAAARAELNVAHNATEI